MSGPRSPRASRPLDFDTLEPRIALSGASVRSLWSVPLITAGVAGPTGVAPYQVTANAGVTVVGHTLPRALVVLTTNGATSTTQSARADVAGRFTFTLNVGVGDTFVSLRETPWYVGKTSVTVAVTRRDATPPTITLTASKPFGNYRLIDGQAIDNGSGVARVERSIDDGPWESIPLLDKSHFETAVFEEPGTEPPHGVRFRAVDKAGNVSAIASSLTLIDPHFDLADFPATLTEHYNAIGVGFTAQLGAGGAVASNYTLAAVDSTGNPIRQVPIVSVTREDPYVAVLHLAAGLPDGSYRLSINDALTDRWGRRIPNGTSVAFDVKAMS